MTVIYGMIYGIKTRSGEHIDISRSEKVTKRYATNQGYKVVTMRNENHYYSTELAEKINGRWVYKINVHNVLRERVR